MFIQRHGYPNPRFWAIWKASWSMTLPLFHFCVVFLIIWCLASLQLPSEIPLLNHCLIDPEMAFRCFSCFPPVRGCTAVATAPASNSAALNEVTCSTGNAWWIYFLRFSVSGNLRLEMESGFWNGLNKKHRYLGIFQPQFTHHTTEWFFPHRNWSAGPWRTPVGCSNSKDVRVVSWNGGPSLEMDGL